MKTSKTIALTLSAFALTAIMPSCIVSQAVDTFVRKEYPGTPPPMVIADAGGRPASGARWLSSDADALPAPSQLIRNPEVAPDGIPFGFTSEYSFIVTSPYPPYNILSYKGFKGGDKVWDPYTRKMFYIPRIHTIN